MSDSGSGRFSVAQPLPLGQLMAGVLNAPDGIEITDVTLDSRTVRPGALFLACRGGTRHGLEFAGQAVTRGARAVLYDEDASDSVSPRADFGPAVFVAGVPQLARHLGTIANRFFGAPSQFLSITAITGTNGKTTCAYLLAQALTRCGRPAAYIGTLGFGPPGALEPSNLTTPDVVGLQRQLAELRAQGAQWVSMEVSSHALDQGRTDGTRFRAAAFTNLTRDHLDYHGTMAAYASAKARLFECDTLAARVINIDDDFGLELALRHAHGALVVTSRVRSREDVPSSLRPARYVRAAASRALPTGLAIEVDSSWGESAFTVPLIGDFNVDNVLTVLAALLSADVPLADATSALGQCVPPPGRMQLIEGQARHGLAIVDYAHTPDALAKALRAARVHCAGRLTVVFGCGGDRDAGKRPVMGRIAAELADDVVLTDDNPRGEDPRRIVAGILAGIEGQEAVRIEHDRARAIRGALERARAGDVVVIAGKGHEDYQIYGTERRSFSDEAIARQYFGGQA
jgi:UDP-N-acetylmuramoyl-L-alanyl-D-glutamate--2,6-diaminopimelate ligase